MQKNGAEMASGASQGAPSASGGSSSTGASESGGESKSGQESVEQEGKQVAQPEPAQAKLSSGNKAGTETRGQKGTTRKVAGQKGGAAPIASQASSQGSSGRKSPEVIQMIKEDHRKVEQLFQQFAAAGDAQKERLIDEICRSLTIHTILEEELLYPAIREALSDEDKLDEAQVEHDSAKILVMDLMQADEDDEFRDAKVRVLAEQIKHHVAEEEKPNDGILAKAEAEGLATADLAMEMRNLRAHLESERRLPPGRPVSLASTPRARARQREENDMPRNQDMPERDDRGRFMSDDDRRYASRSGGGRGSRRYDDDDDRGSRSSRSRYEDDDDRSSRSGRGGGGNRGQGGWFGDSEGHSEASRRGWDNPDHGDSGWYGDSRGHSEASRRGWDNPDHGDSGWFGDPEGHSEASRRGWEDRGGSRSSRGGGRGDDDDRSYRSSSGGESSRGGGGRGSSDRGGGDRRQGGWFGDSEGHSEASRRGWEDRGGSRGRGDDVDRSSRSGRSGGGRSSRDDDDDDRGRGRGGWFGDSRGHSEASRRGWESRH